MPVFLTRRLPSIKLSRFMTTTKKGATFGLLFDIDGVLVRSNRVLPYVKETFSRLVDYKGKFRVPTVFVTNAGNRLRHQKASQLTNWLDVEVNEEQVIMAHSPLSMFTSFHEKHALISGQGPVVDIANSLGFKNVITMEKLRDTFPSLDAVDHERYRPVLWVLLGLVCKEGLRSTFKMPLFYFIWQQCNIGCYFRPVEVVVLFGEPVRWETSLQLLIDVLMTNGLPTEPPNEIIYPHIPVIACNMDLQWMAEACMPRFGHGAFLICLENLYKKITNRELIYTALVGKPSEITYHHAHKMIMKQAKEIGIEDQIKTLYAIGDNVNTDIFGANLYDQYLKKNSLQSAKQFPWVSCNIEKMLSDDKSDLEQGARACESVLVETGVFSPERSDTFMNHTPRDFLPVEERLIKPTFIAKCVSDAIEIIFFKHKYE